MSSIVYANATVVAQDMLTVHMKNELTNRSKWSKPRSRKASIDKKYNFYIVFVKNSRQLNGRS